MNIVEYIGSIGGITGVLAFFIFMTYRYLVAQMREDRKFMEDRLTRLNESYNDVIREHNEAMNKHTQVLTELITWLQAKNGHS
jgi:Mg2+ and Co2+ transporter CorA